MEQKEGFIDTHSDTGQLERLMNCIEFSKVLASIYDMETLLKEVLQRLKFDHCRQNWSFLLVDRQTRELYFAVVGGWHPEKMKGIRLKIGEGIAGAVAQRGQPIFIPDVNRDPRFFPPGPTPLPALTPGPSSPCPSWSGGRSSASLK